MNEDEDVARQRFDELVKKMQHETLTESQYFDMALYCANRNRIYEGCQYMQKWTENVFLSEEGDELYYDNAFKLLSNLDEE